MTATELRRIGFIEEDSDDWGSIFWDESGKVFEGLPDNDALSEWQDLTPGQRAARESVVRLSMAAPFDDAADDALERAEEHSEAVGAARERYPLLPVDVLDPDRPPRRWLLEGVVPEGDHVSIVAPGGTGKSLFALALSLAAVRGAELFIGRHLDFPPGRRVLYIDMENSEDDWHERLTDLGLSDAEFRALHGSTFFPLSLPALRGLDTAQGAAELFALLDAYGITAGDFVVLDSTQRLTEGGENDNDTIRALVNHAGAELKRRGLSVLRTDNTGWDQSRERGASGKRDDVGYSWLLKPEREGGEVFTLTNSKHRSKGSGSRIRFQRADDDGRLVFGPAVLAASESKAATFKSTATEVLRRMLESAQREKDTSPTAGRLSKTQLLKAVREERKGDKAFGFSDLSATEWLSELAKARYIVKERGKQNADLYLWRRDFVIAPEGGEDHDDGF